jgi:hypothetical protein
MSKKFLPYVNMVENIPTLGQNAQAKVCFDLGLNITI